MWYACRNDTNRVMFVNKVPGRKNKPNQTLLKIYFLQLPSIPQGEASLVGRKESAWKNISARKWVTFFFFLKKSFS